MQRSFRSKLSAGISSLAIVAAVMVAGVSTRVSAAETPLVVTPLVLDSSSAEAMQTWDRVAKEHAKAIVPAAYRASASWRFYGVAGAETAFRRNFAVFLRQHVQQELGPDGSLRDHGQLYAYQVSARLDYIPTMKAMRITSEAIADDRIVAVHTSVHSVKDDVGAITPNGSKALTSRSK